MMNNFIEFVELYFGSRKLKISKNKLYILVEDSGNVYARADKKQFDKDVDGFVSIIKVINIKDKEYIKFYEKYIYEFKKLKHEDIEDNKPFDPIDLLEL